ncbi:hypothetical protein ACJX0J_032490, partial [Zea mays]
HKKQWTHLCCLSKHAIKPVVSNVATMLLKNNDFIYNNLSGCFFRSLDVLLSHMGVLVSIYNYLHVIVIYNHLLIFSNNKKFTVISFVYFLRTNMLDGLYLQFMYLQVDVFTSIYNDVVLIHGMQFFSATS